jgi:type II secretory pathway pseudopilin PulG
MRSSQQTAGQRRPNSAFTLFELIGVLTIISIILAIVAPMTLQMLKLQRQQADEAALPEIAQALKLAMMREQSFPFADASVASNVSDSLFWSTMAARHGAGSANEIRYSDNQQSVERKLYFAGPIVDTAFAGNLFFDIVSGSGAAGQWLIDFEDPSELRLLLLSTINPDLPLPSTLSTAEFDAIWESWSNAPGAPTASDVGSFGLTAAWVGRAGELNIERIDLRDFLCQVAIENAYYASGFYDTSGQLKGSFSASDFGFSTASNYLRATVQIGTENLAGAKVALNLSNTSIVTETVDPGPPAITIDHEATQLDATAPVVVLNAGRIIDEASDANIRIRLQAVDVSGPASSTEYTFTIYDASATNSRAPMRLQDPDPPNAYFALSFTGTFSDHYFLKGQKLYLDLPWWASFATTPDPIEYPITENQSTLRFDGLTWHY